MKKIFILLALNFYLASCVMESAKKQEIEGVVNGWWTIDTIICVKHNTNYNLRQCLKSNSIFFKFDDKSVFPTGDNYCSPIITNNYDQYADVKLLNSENPNDSIPFRLKITTKNEIFSGDHQIIFYKDQNDHLLKMEILSDKLYILCRKGLFDYDDNISLINDLEKTTWTNRRFW
jgi:hypothetical protein